jgi:hypothetical protein
LKTWHRVPVDDPVRRSPLGPSVSILAGVTALRLGDGVVGCLHRKRPGLYRQKLQLPVAPLIRSSAAVHRLLLLLLLCAHASITCVLPLFSPYILAPTLTNIVPLLRIMPRLCISCPWAEPDLFPLFSPNLPKFLRSILLIGTASIKAAHVRRGPAANRICHCCVSRADCPKLVPDLSVEKCWKRVKKCNQCPCKGERFK